MKTKTDLKFLREHGTLQANLLRSLANGELTAKWIEEETKAVADLLDHDLPKIDGDKDLAEAGRARRKREKVVAEVARVGTLFNAKLDGLAEALRQARADASKADGATDPGRVEELRQATRGLSSVQIGVLHATATPHDQRALEQIFDAPMPIAGPNNSISWQRVLPENVVSETRLARVTAAHPEIARKLDDLATITEVTQRVAGSLESALVDATPPEPPAEPPAPRPLVFLNQE